MNLAQKGSLHFFYKNAMRTDSKFWEGLGLIRLFLMTKLDQKLLIYELKQKQNSLLTFMSNPYESKTASSLKYL